MMIGVTRLRCGHFKYWNSVLAFNSLKPSSVSVVATNRFFSKKSDSKESECCTDVAQTEGRKVVPWPKDEPPKQGSWPKFDHNCAAWRCDCPRDPSPPNNDPYRIKQPETVVPPIPTPTDVKWTGCVLMAERDDQHQDWQQQGHGYQGYQEGHEQPKEEEKDQGLLGLLKSFFGRGNKNKGPDQTQMIGHEELQLEVPSEEGLFDSPEIIAANYPGLKDLFQNSPIIHPDYWKEKSPRRVNKQYQDVTPRLGYHGMTKYKFAFHEPWRPLDRLALLGEAERQEAELQHESEVARKEEQT